MDLIKINMLGGFTLEARGVQISDTDNRSRKVWCLLGYLICHRKQGIQQNTLLDLL